MVPLSGLREGDHLFVKLLFNINYQVKTGDGSVSYSDSKRIRQGTVLCLDEIGIIWYSVIG